MNGYYDPTRPARPIIRPSLLFLILGALVGVLVYRYGYLRGTVAVDPRPVTARGSLSDEETNNIDVFKKCSPSVVYITTLADRLDWRTRNVLQMPSGTGSGFIWDDAGHVVTNFHVVQQASAARVTLADQTSYNARLVGVMPDLDLAVLAIDAPKIELPPITVGASHDLRVGQAVYAIGNPFGLDQTMTRGIVSALGRSIQSVTGQEIEDVIQTDAAINPGNSGGPLLDSAGRLIGVNAAIISPAGSSAGIGFAIPVDTVNRVVPQLIKSGHYSRPQLGVQIDNEVSRQATKKLGVEGAMLTSVRPDTPAAAAGLRGATEADDGSFIPGDVVQKIDGHKVKSAEDVFAALQRYSAGETVKLSVYRDGKTVEVPVTLGATVAQ